MDHGTKRAALNVLCRELLGRDLPPLASARKRLGVMGQPSPLLVGLWEADGSLSGRLDRRGPYPGWRASP